MKKLLINYIYWSPVGHAVEALKFSKGFAEANPDIEIHVALSKYTATELTEACPWIKKTYVIDIFEFVEEKDAYSSLKDVPKEWDYIMTNDLILHDTKNKTRLGKEEKGMVGYLKFSQKYFKALLGEGTMAGAMRPELPEGLEYKFNSKVELSLPEEALEFAEQYEHDGPKFCIMLGGSGEYKSYPAVESWLKIISALGDEFSNSKIYLTGVRPTNSGRTNTRSFTEKMIQRVIGSSPNVADCYDIGLWNQLAILKLSDVFISPHTGFAFLAPCVGTPWLAISGGNWPEYFFNHVPFYSVLPDDPEFPYQCQIDKYDNVERIPSILPEKLEEKIPEIIEGTHLLLDESFTYEQALKRHKGNIERSNVRKDRIPKGPGF